MTVSNESQNHSNFNAIEAKKKIVNDLEFEEAVLHADLSVKATQIVKVAKQVNIIDSNQAYDFAKENLEYVFPGKAYLYRDFKREESFLIPAILSQDLIIKTQNAAKELLETNKRYLDVKKRLVEEKFNLDSIIAIQASSESATQVSSEPSTPQHSRAVEEPVATKDFQKDEAKSQAQSSTTLNSRLI